MNTMYRDRVHAINSVLLLLILTINIAVLSFRCKYLSYIILGRNLKYCDSVLGDCRHIPACDHNAKCLFNREFGKNLNLFHCVCNKKGGYKGNGIQCVDRNGTFPNNDPESLASLDIKLQTDFYVDRLGSKFPFPPPKG